MSNRFSDELFSSDFPVSGPSSSGSSQVQRLANPDVIKTYWQKMAMNTGEINSQQFVESLAQAVKANPPTFEQWKAVISYWKSFSLNPTLFKELEKKNKEKSSQVTGGDSIPWIKRQQQLVIAMGWIENLARTAGLKEGSLTWGTMARLPMFSNPGDVKTIYAGLMNAYTKNKPLLYSRWICNVFPFEDTWKLYLARWTVVIRLIRAAGKTSVEGGKMVEGGKRIISAYWDLDLQGNPEKPSGNITMAELVQSPGATPWQYLAAAAVPDVRKLLQCPEIRQGRDVQVIQGKVARLMNSIINSFADPPVSYGDEVDLSVTPGNQFVEHYYRAVAKIATTIRMTNRKYFATTGGPDTRSQRQQHVLLPESLFTF